MVEWPELEFFPKSRQDAGHVKTVRFSLVVARSGRPDAYTPWIDPKDDPAFQKALKEHRVMTVHQQSGAKKDFGEVGFRVGGQSGLLVFSRSLKVFEGKKIVGIDYGLLQAAPAKTDGQKKRAKPPKKDKPKLPPLRIFRPEEEEEHARPEPRPATRKAEEKPAVRPAKRAEKKPRMTLKSLEASMRKAMKELQDGKAVAAYETLQAGLGSS